MKRPAFQFYPGDWLRSSDLRSCSISARGLWIEMICLMHEGKPYGHLKVGDKVILAPDLARMVGVPVKQVNAYVTELVRAGVCSVDSSGCFISRRMVRDERIRLARAAGGPKSADNPNVPRAKERIPLATSLDPSPAFASAVAVPSNKQSGNKTTLPPGWWSTEAGIEATAKTLGINPGTKTYHELKQECFDEINKAKGNGKGKPEPKPAAQCSQCGGSLAGGWTSMKGGRACNPCYAAYLGQSTAPAPPKPELQDLPDDIPF